MHKSRFAGLIIDCQGDDLAEAECFWGQALGATRVGQVKDWCVMEAPTGHRFCVVPVVRADFDNKANTWS